MIGRLSAEQIQARRHHWVSGCFGKDPLTQGQAFRLAERMRARKSAPIHAYRCPSCGQWHVGESKTQRKFRLHG